MIFSTISAIILHEMSSRIGVVTGKGLGENIRDRYNKPIQRLLVVILVFSSIFIGNSAFETGNITGVVMGVTLLSPAINLPLCVITIALIAVAIFLFFGFEKIQNVLSVVVFLMSIIFIVLALLSRPDWTSVINGIANPSFGNGGLMTVVGLIGTTIGPYGLFLHASAASKKWTSPDEVKESRFDTILSISIGGFISFCIVIVAAASMQNGNGTIINDAIDLSSNLVAMWGEWVKYLMSAGLIFAGFSSVLTAPIGAALALTGVLGRNLDFSSPIFKIITICVLLIGTVFSIIFGKSPVQLILFVQVANAIILPLISMFVIICANSETMKKHKNTISDNILGCIVIAVCVLISVRNIINVLNSI